MYNRFPLLFAGIFTVGLLLVSGEVRAQFADMERGSIRFGQAVSESGGEQSNQAAFQLGGVQTDQTVSEFGGGQTDQVVAEFGGQADRSEWGALLRSLVVPGWGHYYIDSDDWRRGQYHLAADVVMIAAWLGIYRQAGVIEKNMLTHARVYSGVDIRAHDRTFELAVGDHRSWDAYIDYLERTRNWDRLDDFPDTPAYKWYWESDELRREYRDMRSRRDNLNRQLPALTAIMVVNRLVSGVSAFSRARSASNPTSRVYLVPGTGHQGFEARLKVTF